MGSATALSGWAVQPRLGHGAVAVGMVLADGRGAVAMGVVLSRWAWCSRDELALPPVFGGDPGAIIAPGSRPLLNLVFSTTPIKSPMVSALTISALEALEWRAIAT